MGCQKRVGKLKYEENNNKKYSDLWNIGQSDPTEHKCPKCQRKKQIQCTQEDALIKPLGNEKRNTTEAKHLNMIPPMPLEARGYPTDLIAVRRLFFRKLIYYIDTSVLLENMPLVKFIKTTSVTRVVYFP